MPKLFSDRNGTGVLSIIGLRAVHPPEIGINKLAMSH
jgi:hypothetical protein